MPDDPFSIDDDQLTVRVHAVPGAGRSEVVGRHGDALKVRVAAPPQAGRANEAIGRVLAEAFDLPAKQVVLVNGDKGRQKAFRISGVEEATARTVIDRLLADGGGRGPARRR